MKKLSFFFLFIVFYSPAFGITAEDLGHYAQAERYRINQENEIKEIPQVNVTTKIVEKKSPPFLGSQFFESVLKEIYDSTFDCLNLICLTDTFNNRT